MHYAIVPFFLILTDIMVARGVLRECLGDLEKLYGGSSSERTLNIK